MEFAVFLAVVVFFVLLTSVVIVRQGYEYTVESFGRFTRTLSPGLHIIIPIVERVGAKINRMEQVLDVPSQDVITKDNATVRVDGVLFFQIQQAANAAYQVKDLNVAILNLIMTNIRTVIGSMEIDELLSQRDAINHKLLAVVDEATIPWGVKVTRVEIKDITPPADLINSMARQMKAEREKRAMIYEAEGEKESSIRIAEGQKEAAIRKAEGEKESSILRAEGIAQARMVEAEAEKEAIKRIIEALSSKGQADKYLIAMKYLETMKEMTSGQDNKIVYMPYEASAVLSSVDGIREMLSAKKGA